MRVLKDTRFGDIEYDDDKSISFPEGLLGFETLRDFLVLPSKNEGPLFWIQSVEDSQVAFVVTDPTSFFPEYAVALDEQERESLGVQEGEEVFVLSIVSVKEGGSMTLNLAAPVLLSYGSKKALQVILEKTQYSTQQPLSPA